MRRHRKKLIISLHLQGPAWIAYLFHGSELSASVNSHIVDYAYYIACVVLPATFWILFYYGFFPYVVRFFEENILTEKQIRQTDMFDSIREKRK